MFYILRPPTSARHRTEASSWPEGTVGAHHSRGVPARLMSIEHGHAVPAPRRGTSAARLAGLALVVVTGAGTGLALARDAAPAGGTPAEEVAAEPAGTPFSYEILTETMRARAAEPPREPERPEGFLGELGHEDYGHIVSRPERARWRDEGPFRVEAFHLGWLYETPVRVHEVVDGLAREMRFSTEDFAYTDELDERVPADATLPGVAGFSLDTPLNHADEFDEFVSFVGASYFRALGRDDVYGLSARGLAIDTGLSSAEEFPRFTEFWLERPAPGEERVTIHAALESESVTGAYRFVVAPGSPTTIDVTARLFFRADVKQLGIAPLTSMYLFGENDRTRFDDSRPEVHDSDGLLLVNRDGEPFWRPLTNPERLASAYLASPGPQAFGLLQRDRDSHHYEDPTAVHEHRPSLLVRPASDWGPGTVRLVEIPSDLEVNDNIVVFWIPDGKVRAGDEREFSYRLEWGRDPWREDDALACVIATRTGHGGPAGVTDKPDSRKFVVDFAGGLLARLPAGAEVEATVTAVNGKVETRDFFKVEGTDRWRLVIDVGSERGATVELVARVEGYGRELSETWLYQWVRP